jgi:hypothetical protein
MLQKAARGEASPAELAAMADELEAARSLLAAQSGPANYQNIRDWGARVRNQRLRRPPGKR